MKFSSRLLVYFLICTFFLSACGGQPVPQNTPVVFVTLTSDASAVNTATPFLPAVDTPVPFPPGVQIGDSVPPSLRAQAESLGINLILDISPGLELSVSANETQIRWLYVLAAPFPTVRDGISFDELKAVWSEGPASALFNGQPILMNESTLAAFTALWGESASGSVRSVPADQLSDTAWTESAWAIIPFESISPRWKVLTIDGQSPIRKGFDLSTYPLIVDFTIQTPTDIQPSAFNLQPSNYDSAKLTTILLTGVTALVRATAYKMEVKGITYPGEGIRDLMREADIAHVSNEVPFFSDCTFPNPNSGRLVFCSDPKYIGLFTDIGVDVVELTGNHFPDYGRKSMDETISIYNSNTIPYYAAGSNLQDALEPALFEINGNKIAFMGCNRPDTDTPKIATEERPGLTPCDFDYLTAKVGELKNAGYVVVFTFQWFESYDSQPNPGQVKDFRRVVDAGASIVSGSQAHFAQAMEFYRDSFIHYGLGNLFFDQMGNFDWMPEGIRREFIDRYVIYDGRLVSVELLTNMLEDFSRPRIMTEEERAGFLSEYFLHSGWTPIVDGLNPIGAAVP